jgi:hypothetical protein
MPDEDLENAEADLRAAEKDVRAAEEVLNAAETEVEAAEKAIEEAEHHRHELTVTVHDEDAGGEPFIFRDSAETRVSTVIDELYKDLQTTRKDGDRLTCLGNGDNVFDHKNETLAHYAEHTCQKLEWGWAGETGGA